MRQGIARLPICVCLLATKQVPCLGPAEMTDDYGLESSHKIVFVCRKLTIPFVAQYSVLAVQRDQFILDSQEVSEHILESFIFTTSISTSCSGEVEALV